MHMAARKNVATMGGAPVLPLVANRVYRRTTRTQGRDPPSWETDRLIFAIVEGGGTISVHSSSKPTNSSVQSRQLYDASQLVATLRRAPGGEPVEGSGGELVLEDNGEPCREKDECG